jgi:hypothetical protein
MVFLDFVFNKKNHNFAIKNMQVAIASNEKYQPFSNLQLELLKLYADNVEESDLLEIKRIIAQYFADKASNLADIAWEQRNLNEASLLNTNMRTTYKRQSK